MIGSLEKSIDEQMYRCFNVTCECIEVDSAILRLHNKSVLITVTSVSDWVMRS